MQYKAIPKKNLNSQQRYKVLIYITGKKSKDGSIFGGKLLTLIKATV